METILEGKLKAKLGKPKKSEVKIEIEVSAEEFELFRVKALRELGKDVKLQGFRPGKAPDSLLEQTLRSGVVLEEGAEMTIRYFYPQILDHFKLQPVTPPQIKITKIGLQIPLEFEATLGVYPEIELPNYKKIGKEVWEKREKPKATEADVEKIISEILASRKDEAGKEPELNDEFAKSLGQFESVADLKKKLLENLSEEKSYEAEKKSEEEIVRKIVEKTDISLPESLLEMELHEAQHELKNKLAKINKTFDEYLASIKKTEEEITKEQKGQIEHSLKTRFILGKILETEKITAEAQELGDEIQALSAISGGMPEDRLKEYAASAIINRKLFKLLKGEVEEIAEKLEKDAEPKE